MNSAQRIYTQPRGTGFAGRGGAAKPHIPQAGNHHQPDRPLPASYVCYRCGQKGQFNHFSIPISFLNLPKDTGYTTVPRIMTGNSTTNLESNGRLVYREVSLRLLIIPTRVG